MEGKNKIALFTLSALIPLAVGIGFFCCANFAHAADSNLIISEILIGGDSASEEFIELYNPTSADIDLKLLPLKLHTVNSSGTDTSKTLTYLSSDSTIKAHDYFLLASPSFKEKNGDIGIGITYSASLVSNGAVYISTSATKSSDIIDLVCWGTSTVCTFSLPDPKQNHSLERIGDDMDWQESCETGGTPGKELQLCEEDIPMEEDIDSEDGSGTDYVSEAASEKVFLSEILPNPKGDEEKDEFIEIVNGDSGPVDLFGWTIRDGSKTGKYVFKEHTEIASGEYLAIYRSDSKITLNNSSESVTLYNPQGEITSSVSYNKSTEDASYSFDGKNWKWSKYLTPGKENKFDSEPSVKITKSKHAYKDLFTEFSAKAKDKETKKLKYTWNFGDGKKSYLAKTSHKYLDTGKYTVTLSVTDDSQTVEKSFALQVKKYPRPDIEIVKIIPNPAGNDSESETVDVKNNSGKKIDLAGWKIATGSGGKIYNHPIIGEFSVGPNETKTITREFSKFSLSNKAGKVQLVMPDGKVADAVEYAKDPPDSLRDSKQAGKIAEDEAYVKIDGEWRWIEPGTKDENDNPGDETTDENAALSEDEDPGEVLGATDNNISVSPSYSSRFTSEDAYIFLSQIDFAKPLEKEMSYRPAADPSSNIAYLIASLI
jgi:hypothetical protein